MAIFIVDTDDDAGPSREQLEDQVEALAELLRVAYGVLADQDEDSDLLAAIEDLLKALDLDL